MMMTSINATGTLTARQLRLCAVAALEARGDLERLSPAIEAALDEGVTVAELKEALSQLYAYTGFPRSLNALGVLSRVIEQRTARGAAVPEGEPWTRPALWNDAAAALATGTEVQTRLSGQPFDYQFCPQNDYYLKSHLFGDIFAGGTLSEADRELVTVSALSALEGVAPQLAAHKAGAVNMGNTPEAVDELCRWLSSQGLTASDGAAAALNGAWPLGQPNTAYAQYFIGNSYLAPMGAVTNVTFEPGCRNNWHIHHGAVQVLICVSGRGWYQEWGKPAVALTPGVVIAIPAEVKHWHGAAADSWLQHLTYMTDVRDGSSNEWLEPVNNATYTEATANR